jgi:hypothetical protein
MYLGIKQQPLQPTGWHGSVMSPFVFHGDLLHPAPLIAPRVLTLPPSKQSQGQQTKRACASEA